GSEAAIICLNKHGTCCYAQELIHAVLVGTSEVVETVSRIGDHYLAKLNRGTAGICYRSGHGAGRRHGDVLGNWNGNVSDLAAYGGIQSRVVVVLSHERVIAGNRA